MTEDQLAAIRARHAEDDTGTARDGMYGFPIRRNAHEDRAALLAEVGRLTAIQREIEARPEWRLRVDLSHAQHQIQVEQGERFKYGRALEVADAEIARLRAFRGRVAAHGWRCRDGFYCHFCDQGASLVTGKVKHAADCLYLEATAP